VKSFFFFFTAVIFLAQNSGVIAQEPASNLSGNGFSIDDSSEANRNLQLMQSWIDAQLGTEPAKREWSESMGLLDKLSQQHGDKIISPIVGASARNDLHTFWYLNVNRYLQMKAATLPEEARAAYRRNVEHRAAAQLKDAVDKKDLDALWNLSENYFLTESGVQALEIWADESQSKGNYEDALSAYNRIVQTLRRGNAPHTVSDLITPERIAEVQAKKILALARLGQKDEALKTLADFKAEFPEAKGDIAGRNGLYADSLMAAIESDDIVPQDQDAKTWPVMTGNKSGTRIVAGEIKSGDLTAAFTRPFLQLFSPTLPDPVRRNVSPYSRVTTDFGAAPTTTASKPIHAFFPTIVDDKLWLSNFSQIIALGLEEGADSKPLITLSTRAARPTPNLPMNAAVTAANGRIFGVFSLEGQATIAAIDPADTKRALWEVNALQLNLPKNEPPAAANAVPPRFPVRTSMPGQLLLSAAPIADDQTLYVSLIRSENGLLEYFVSAIDQAHGKVLWTQVVHRRRVDSPNYQNHIPKRQPYLALGNRSVYWQSNSGAVASLDSRSGKLRWLTTYTRRDELDTDEVNNEMISPIVYEGLVYVAPADSRSLFAFDANTGDLAWRTNPLPRKSVRHLIGIADNKIFVTGSHVTTVDRFTGRVLNRWPEGEGKNSGGRGILVGENFLWPTQNDGVIALNVKTLQPAEPKLVPETGHLAATRNYLAITNGEKITVYRRK